MKSRPTRLPDTILALNVGGSWYDTTIGTLQNGGSSKLLEMCLGQWQNKSKVIFIDRDGRHFCYILNYLRIGLGAAFPSDILQLQELRTEAKFYGLAELVNLIDAKIMKQSTATTTHAQLSIGTKVTWNPSMIDCYWDEFVSAAIDNFRKESQNDSKFDHSLFVFFERFKPEMKHLIGTVVSEEFQAGVNTACPSADLVHQVFKIPRIKVQWNTRRGSKVAVMVVSTNALTKLVDSD